MKFIFLTIITLLSSIASSDDLQHPLISLGCFVLPQSNSSNHTLTYSHETEISGARACVTVCREKQFRYAGIVAQKQCMCGLTFRGESSDGCRECVTNSQHMCGGAGAVSVYETGGSVPGPPLNLNLLNQTSEGLYITWDAPISDGSPEILQYQVTATPLDSVSGLEPPSTRTWELGEESRSAWLYGVHPATHYTLEVRAANTEGLGPPARTEGWTSISAPPIPPQPEMLSRTPESITVKMHTVSPVGGPITAYQIVVVDETVGAIMNPSALTDYYNASKEELPYYITAQFSPDNFQTVFTVGDKKIYDGYYNAPLKTNTDYHILLGVVSRMNQTLASYSPSDHNQHLSSDLSEDLDESLLPSSHAASHDTHDHKDTGAHAPHQKSSLTFGLSVSVAVLGCLVLIAAVIYIALRVYLRAPRRPDHQELTANCHDNGELQADGLSHYLNEEDLPDHYSRLKQRVAVMRPADLTIVGDVGQGAFGAIKKGVMFSNAQVHSANHTEGSVLVHHILDSSLCARDKAAMLRSLGQHVSLGQHKNIIALLGLVEHVTEVSLVFEYETHSLKQQLTDARALTHYPVYAEKHRRFSTISEHQVLSLLCNVARGLQYLHSCGVAHGAICARNVVVQGTVAKLTGFGLLSYTNDVYEPDYRRWVARELLSHWAASSASGGGGAEQQTAPASRVCSVSGDVWSFGVLVWESVTLGATPYPDLPADQITPRVQTGLRPPQAQYVSSDLYQLMLDCWQLDPSQRPHLPRLEGSLSQLADEGSHLLFATYAGFQYHLYAPHLEFLD